MEKERNNENKLIYKVGTLFLLWGKVSKNKYRDIHNLLTSNHITIAIVF